jgi:hypothetical protein
VSIHPTWKLGYAVYLVSLKNGGAAVAVAIDSEDESLSQNAPSISTKGPQGVAKLHRELCDQLTTHVFGKACVNKYKLCKKIIKSAKTHVLDIIYSK